MLRHFSMCPSGRLSMHILNLRRRARAGAIVSRRSHERENKGAGSPCGADVSTRRVRREHMVTTTQEDAQFLCATARLFPVLLGSPQSVGQIVGRGQRVCNTPRLVSTLCARACHPMYRTFVSLLLQQTRANSKGFLKAGSSRRRDTGATRQRHTHPFVHHASGRTGNAILRSCPPTGTIERSQVWCESAGTPKREIKCRNGTNAWLARCAMYGPTRRVDLVRRRQG